MQTNAEKKQDALSRSVSELGADDAKRKKAEERIERIGQRAANRVARMQNMAAFNERLKEEGTQYLNYWGIQTKAQRDAERALHQKSDKNFSQEKMEKLAVAGASPASVADTPSGTSTQGGGNTPSGGTQGTGDGTNGGETSTPSLMEQYFKQSLENAKYAAKERAEAWRAASEELKTSRSAYQKLVEGAMKKKEEIATRKERDARSKAFINALGSIVNVITAGALARRGGHAPIVAEYDKSYDTDLRKSIEGRYEMENENENLLLSLQKERQKYEDDIIMGGYKATVDTINAEEKAKNDIIKALVESENIKAKDDASLQRALTLMNRREEIRSENEHRRDANREAREEARESKKASAAEQGAFVSEMIDGVTIYNDVTGEDEPLKSKEIKAPLNAIIEDLAQAGMKNNEKARAYVKELVKTEEGRKRIKTESNKVAQEAIKAGNK